MPKSKKVVNKTSKNKTKKKKTDETSSTLTVVEENPVTLVSDKDDILKKVFEADNIDELKDLTNLFGISLTKKEIARASRESDLLDKLLEIASDRINTKGEFLSHDELLDYLRTFQSNVDKSKRTLNDEIDKSSVRVQNTKNEININVNTGTELSRDSREKVLDVVNAILKQSQENKVLLNEEEDNND